MHIYNREIRIALEIRYTKLDTMIVLRKGLRHSSKGVIFQGRKYFSSIFERNNDKTSVSPNSIAMRFLLCIDPKFTWDKLVSPMKHPITHPNSEHFVNQLLTLYNKRPYNYNDVGEFELIIAPTAVYSSKQSNLGKYSDAQILSYPDNINFIFPPSTPNSHEITKAYGLFMKSVKLQENDASASSVLIQESMQNPIIVVNISPEHPWSRAQKTISGIEQSLMKYSKTDIDIVITRDIVNMSVIGKWEIMVLPFGDRAHNLLTIQEIDRFLSRSLIPIDVEKK